MLKGKVKICQDITHICVIINHRSRGDYTFGSIHPSVCRSVHLSVSALMLEHKVNPI